MAAERPFKQQGTIPFTWEIRPGVPRDQPEQHQHHQRHGSSDNTTIISDEEECKKKSYNIVSSYSRIQSDQPQKKPRTRTRTRSRSFMDIYNFFKPRVSPFVGEKDKVKVRPEASSDLGTMSSCGSVKKSSSKRSSSPFSSGRWSSSLGSDVKWSAFGYH